MHVLIVEDDSSTRRFLKVILEKLGYSTTECETAELGWEAYQREAHAIALLDWMLPGMSGVELCRQIRATPNGEQTVILMSTSQDQLADIEVALKAGADDYIIKPVDIKQMKIRLFIAEQRVRALKDQNQIKTAIKNKLKGLEAERAGLHELIAPVIPIWDGILILPINGPIDNHRMCLIRRKTLQSIRTMQAKQIILDLTAVPLWMQMREKNLCKPFERSGWSGRIRFWLESTKMWLKHSWRSYRSRLRFLPLQP